MTPEPVRAKEERVAQVELTLAEMGAFLDIDLSCHTDKQAQALVLMRAKVEAAESAALAADTEPEGNDGP